MAPGAEVIAVVPFSVSGTVDFTGEAMVDLVSATLDQVDAIRTVAPQTVLRRWQRSAAEGRPALEEELTIGRDVGAGSVLTGSVVQGGEQVRIDATLYELSGEPLAQVHVAGASDDVLGLVDSVGIALLRDVWRSREPVPNVYAAAVTSDDLSAIQAFLEGERYYRRLQLDSAAAAFRRAIEADSTFAFAHLRLALSQEWSSHLTDRQDVANNFRTAVRLRERLPRRERSLVEGVMLAWDESPEAALEHLSHHVQRFPDHAEGWFRLADVQYHGPHALDLEHRQLLAPFDRAIELDPTFAPALPHALTLMVAQLDSASMARYERELRDGGNLEWAERFRAAHALLWVSLDSLSTALTGPLWGGGRGGEVLHAAAFRSDRYGPDDVIEALRAVADTLPPDSPLRPPLAEMRVKILLGTGRLRAAGPVLDTLLWSPVPWRSRQLSGGAAFAGFADSSYVRPLPGPAASLPPINFVIDSMSWAVMREDADEVRMYAEEGLRTGVLRSLFTGGLGLSQVMAGDTAAGRERLRSSMAQMAVLSPPVLQSHVLFRWLELLAADPESRRRAIRYLERVIWHDMPVYESLAHRVRARALEAEGDSTAAAEAYDRFLELMRDADPDVGIRSEIEEAEAAWARLGGG